MFDSEMDDRNVVTVWVVVPLGLIEFKNFGGLLLVDPHYRRDSRDMRVGDSVVVSERQAI